MQPQTSGWHVLKHCAHEHGMRCPGCVLRMPSACTKSEDLGQLCRFVRGKQHSKGLTNSGQIHESWVFWCKIVFFFHGLLYAYLKVSAGQ